MVRRDVPHPPHVRSERVHTGHSACGLQRGVPPAQVQQLELVGVHLGVLRVLQVDPSDPVPLLLQKGDEVVSMKPPPP